MTVDVIEYAWRLKEVSWFVLATGDSDFSPLFRRLREMGKGVIGVGPRSTLSETVKTSCSRYIYTESVAQRGESAIQSAYEDAVDNVGRILSAFREEIHLSLLKSKLLNLDSAFDEKELGYSSFSGFIESIEDISLNKRNTICHRKDPIQNKIKTIALNEKEIELSTQYKSILRKKNWRILPKEYLVSIFSQLKKIAPSTKEQLRESLLDILGENITPTDVRKAFSIFIKCQLLQRVDINSLTNEALWGIKEKNVTEHEMLIVRDIAVVSRVFHTCHEENIMFDHSAINNILYSTGSTEDLNQIIMKAKTYTINTE